MADKTTQNDKSSSDIQAHLDALLSEEDWSSLPTRRTGKSGADEVAEATNFSANGYDDDDVEANLLRAKPRFDPSTRRLYQHERSTLKSLAVLGVAAAFLGYFISPFGQIQKFNVVGTQDLSDKAVLKAAGLQLGQPLFSTVHQSAYFNKLAQKNDPQVASLKLRLVGTNTVEVKVKEIVQVGYVKAGSRYYPILANGTMLKHGSASHPVGGLPLYDGFTSGKQLKLTLSEFGKLSTPLRHAVSEIVWSPDAQNAQSLKLYMNDGNQVLISADDLSKKLRYYPGMVAQLDKPGQADLQVGAYFTPYQ